MDDFDEDDLIAQAEREFLDQELSARFAGQPDFDEEDEEMMRKEEEEEPPSDYELEENDKGDDDEQARTAPSRGKESPTESKVRIASREYVANDKSYHDYFLKRPLLQQKQMTITLGNGDRRFFGERTDTQRSYLCKTEDKKWTQQFDSKLFQKIESEVELKIVVERRVAEAIESNNIPKRKSAPSSPSQPIATLSVNAKQRRPLVQKFAPVRFIDLLSHERRNRDALKWLKSFDRKVEGKEYPKVLLLSGPPGSGKTTLAHVLARHAGYCVVEINASDERTAGGLKEKIASATEMKSVFDGETARPNLVVLDEIDGVSDGVQAVLQYATNPANTRPIICTCNDPYTPALRPLRRIAFVLNIALPSRSRLVKRLREICAVENIDQRPGALELLSNRMDDDIRASLNALDFWLKSYRHQEIVASRQLDPIAIERPPLLLDVTAVRALPAFAKDGTADLWSTWRKLLTRQPTAPSSKSTDILAVVSRHMGDLDMVVDGLHENYLRNRFMDPSFTKTWKACEWLSFVDTIQTKISRDMDFSFGVYCAAGCVAAGRVVMANSAGRYSFPTATRIYRDTKLRNQEAIQEFFQNPTTARNLNRREFATDIISPLLTLLVPHVRPINVQAMSPSERNEFERVVQLLNELQLVWMDPDRSMSTILARDSPKMCTLDPPIDQISTFRGIERSGGHISVELVRALSSRVKAFSRDKNDDKGFRQISSSSLSSSVNAETNADRTSARKKIKSTPEPQELPPKTSSPSLDPAIATTSKKSNSSTVAQPGVKRDFFGRIIQPKAAKRSAVEESQSESSERKTGEEGDPDSEFIFRFNEGLTDAVRRVVKIQDL